MNPLAFEFMQQALVACTVVCAVAPVVGMFTVQRRQSLIGDGIGHVAFAGVGLALLVRLHPLVGALGLAVVSAVALHRLQRGRVAGDVALALVFYAGIAAGYLFAAKSAAGTGPVLALLFGSPLNLSWGQVAAVAALALVVLVVVLALYHSLLAIAFDEAAARVAGVRTDALVLVLTLVVALVVVGGMYAIGLLLISAMMVLPVAAAARLASSHRMTMALAAAIGAASAVVGLLIAFFADVPPGPAIVLVTVACYAATSGAGRTVGRAR